MQHWLKLQQSISFWRNAPNLFMLASCLANRVNILFKCIWELRNITKKMFFIIFHVVIMRNCWTIIAVINATWLNFKLHSLFGVPLQTSSFLYYDLYNLYMISILLRNIPKYKNLPLWYEHIWHVVQKSLINIFHLSMNTICRGIKTFVFLGIHRADKRDFRLLKKSPGEKRRDIFAGLKSSMAPWHLPRQFSARILLCFKYELLILYNISLVLWFGMFFKNNKRTKN